MSANNLCSFFRSCYDDCVRADAVFSWRPDAGVLEAGRGQSRRKTRASWRPDAGALEARRGQSGRKTRALWRQDAGRRGVKLFLGSTVYRSSPRTGSKLIHLTLINYLFVRDLIYSFDFKSSNSDRTRF